jgi:hypothetical protein
MKSVKDLFSKEKFQQELAEEISKDLKRNLTNSPTKPSNNRHN